MARVQGKLGQGKPMPPFFTGHETNGAPNRPGHHTHLFYAVDLAHEPARLLIVAPHYVEHRPAAKWEREHLQFLEVVLEDFTLLRAGGAGLFKLSPLNGTGESDAFCGVGRTWVSATPFRPTRHSKRTGAIEDELIAGVVLECARRNLPPPRVEVISAAKGPRGGLHARVRLAFAVAIEGPILLGQDAHKSGGVFRRERASH